ncbi:MAG: MarR family transcriptional regulator [Pseudomonadota bacterium]
MQGFERYSAESVRACGLTPPQFDLIATLGNTPGMSCKELGEKTLITKGTLTGVIDRLEKKGLVERHRSGSDKRSMFIRLTPCGERMFQDAFPKVVAQGKALFAPYDEADFAALETTLGMLKARIDAGSAARSGKKNVKRSPD